MPPGAQPVVVAGEGHRGPEKVLVVVHTFDEGRQKQQELGVLPGGGAGLEQIFARVGGEGPVVVLAGAVDAREGLLMEQAHQSVAVATFFIISITSWFWSQAALALV